MVKLGKVDFPPPAGDFIGKFLLPLEKILGAPL